MKMQKVNFGWCSASYSALGAHSKHSPKPLGKPLWSMREKREDERPIMMGKTLNQFYAPNADFQTSNTW